MTMMAISTRMMMNHNQNQQKELELELELICRNDDMKEPHFVCPLAHSDCWIGEVASGFP